MNNDAIELYCRKVGKELLCSPETKQRLLQGLRQELQELGDTTSVKAIVASYGKAEQTAAAFQETIPDTERSMAIGRLRKRQTWIAIATITFALCVLILCCMIHNATPIYSVEEIVEGTAVTIP